MDYNWLQQKLKDRRNAGETNQQMADTFGISQAHINRLLNGMSVQIGSLKFATILRMFPEIEHLLTQYCSHKMPMSVTSASASGNGAATAINGNATAAPVHLVDPQLNDAVLNAIIMDDDMCDKCRSIALRHIMTFRNQENNK